MLLDAFRSIIVAYPNMTARQIVALLVLRDSKDILCREMASEMKVNRSVVSRTWDTLSIYGLIKRRRGDDDARDVHASLTDKGEMFCNQLDGV